MSEDDFLKRSFRPFMEITYSNNREKNIDGGVGLIIDCLLVAVDFDERQLKLQPIPNDYIRQEDFWANCENCIIPPRKLKLLKS